MELTNENLIEALDKLGLKVEVQEKTEQLHGTFSNNGYDYPIFVRQLEGGNLLQMLTFVPCTIEEKSSSDLNRLLHMINKELDMPGFCCDEESKTVFYRVVIPCMNKKIDEALFQAYFQATKHVCNMFGTIVHAIAVNAMTLEEMMSKAKEEQAKKAESSLK
jgi:hypothetical protein